MTTAVTLENVSCSYGAFPVLHNISLEFAPGTFWGIIGPNGSGKTTLLKTILGILKPTSGRVLLDGSDISLLSRRAIAQRIGVVPQDVPGNFSFTSREIVAMGRTPYLGRLEPESQVDRTMIRQAMQKTDCWHLRNRSFDTLSGGERQRVVLARALAQDPEIILLDEPTSHLDLKYQLKTLDILRRLNREEGISVIIVIHDINLACQYCDELVLLQEGRVVAVGPVEEVVNPRNMEQVFGVDVAVSVHPLSHRPQITPLSRHQRQLGKHRIHIIAGGGEGSGLVEDLWYDGYQLSLGVLNVGDADWQLARSYGIETITVPAFAPITSEAHEKHLKLIEETEAVILANIPFGGGNLRNLEAALRAAEMGIPVIIIDETPIGHRDYSPGNEARDLYRELTRQEAATLVRSGAELKAVLMGLFNLSCKEIVKDGADNP